MPVQKNILTLLQKSDLYIPIVIFLIYVIAFLAIRGTLPTASELINDFSSIYARYGYYIIFISAVLESLVVVNFFVPGLVAMSMGALFARTGQTQLPLVIVAASLGLIIGYNIDFLLGSFGFSKIIKKIGYRRFIEVAQGRLLASRNISLVLGFIYPPIAVFLSLVAGMTRQNFLAFFLFSIGSTFLWITLWATLIYIIGEIFLKVLTNYSYILIIIFIGLYLLIQKIKHKKT